MSGKKSNYCLNPKTNRQIMVGGRMWRKMVKQGVIDAAEPDASGFVYNNPNMLYTVQEDEYENPQEAKEELYRQKNRIAEENTNPRKRPMVYKNHIVMADKRLTNEETATRTADAAIDVIDDIQNNYENIPANMSREDAHKYLQGLIFDKMLAQKKPFKNTRLAPKPQREIKIQPPPRNIESKLSMRRSVSVVDRPKKGQKLKPLRRVNRNFESKLSEPLYINEDETDEDYIEEEEEEDYVDKNYTEDDYNNAYTEWQQERFNKP